MKLKDKKFKTVAVKGGKQYVEVKERLEYLSKEFEGEYSINTDYQYFEAVKIWVVKATLTLVQEGKTSTYTGLGQEKEGGTGVNSTSALENAETSAVGRACAMAGIGIDISIASADEVNKATNSQPAPKQEIAVEATVMATNKQKEELQSLLNDPVITSTEKAKGLTAISGYTEERATKAITKLKEVIADRKAEQDGAPEVALNYSPFREE